MDEIGVPADADVVSLDRPPRAARPTSSPGRTRRSAHARSTASTAPRRSRGFPDTVCQLRGGRRCELRAETLDDDARRDRYVDPDPPAGRGLPDRRRRELARRPGAGRRLRDQSTGRAVRQAERDEPVPHSGRDRPGVPRAVRLLRGRSDHRQPLGRRRPLRGVRRAGFSTATSRTATSASNTHRSRCRHSSLPRSSRRPQPDYLFAFKLMMTGLGVVVLLATGYSLGRLGAERTATLTGLGTIALAPLLLGHVFLNRYDLWPTALVALAVAGYLSHRDACRLRVPRGLVRGQDLRALDAADRGGADPADTRTAGARSERCRVRLRMPGDLLLLPRNLVRRAGVQLLDAGFAGPPRRKPARLDPPRPRHHGRLRGHDRSRRSRVTRPRWAASLGAGDAHDHGRGRRDDRVGLVRLSSIACARMPSSSRASPPPQSRSSPSPR